MKMTDRHGKNIIENCLVKYQVGTKHEAIFKLVKDGNGILRFRFPKGDGASMEGKARSAAWHEASDRKISEIVFDASEYDYYNGKIYCSGCCEGWSSHVSEVDGICPDCGAPTVDGTSASGCSYSPCDCETCGDCPCDGSC